MTTITEAALIRRVNRKLAHEGQAMRKARTRTTDLGLYYVVDRDSGSVESAHQDDIAEFAREEGVLKPSERVEGGESSQEGLHPA